MLELKSAPRANGSVPPLWLTRLFPMRVRPLHLAPLAILLILGASVPGFLWTLTVLLISVVAALGVFVLLIQLPVSYLVHYWRDLRRGSEARQRTPRGAPSNGV
jgi:UPF0716 family protein affecting phage T7 exclusion